MSIRIRLAGQEDVPTLTAMEDALFQDSWGEASIASHLASPHAHALIALEGEHPVGYCFFTSLLSEGELLRIATDPNRRRRGIARALLSEMLTIAPNDTLFLEVRSKNAPAIALYESFGFRAYGTRRDYYKNPRDDALVMSRIPDNT